MGKVRLFVTLSAAMVILAPRTAFAATATVPRALDLGVGAAALVLAGVMLLDVLALRRVAAGAAIAEHITYVMAAVACLAASVLSEWVVRFSHDSFAVSLGQLGSELLVIAAMSFFALYFFFVRRAMCRFVRRGAEAEALARAQMAEDDAGDADGEPDAELDEREAARG